MDVSNNQDPQLVNNKITIKINQLLSQIKVLCFQLPVPLQLPSCNRVKLAYLLRFFPLPPLFLCKSKRCCIIANGTWSATMCFSLLPKDTNNME